MPFDCLCLGSTIGVSTGSAGVLISHCFGLEIRSVRDEKERVLELQQLEKIRLERWAASQGLSATQIEDFKRLRAKEKVEHSIEPCLAIPRLSGTPFEKQPEMEPAPLADDDSEGVFCGTSAASSSSVPRLTPCKSDVRGIKASIPDAGGSRRTPGRYLQRSGGCHEQPVQSVDGRARSLAQESPKMQQAYTLTPRSRICLKELINDLEYQVKAMTRKTRNELADRIREMNSSSTQLNRSSSAQLDCSGLPQLHCNSSAQPDCSGSAQLDCERLKSVSEQLERCTKNNVDRRFGLSNLESKLWNIIHQFEIRMRRLPDEMSKLEKGYCELPSLNAPTSVQQCSFLTCVSFCVAEELRFLLPRVQKQREILAEALEKKIMEKMRHVVTSKEFMFVLGHACDNISKHGLGAWQHGKLAYRAVGGTLDILGAPVTCGASVAGQRWLRAVPTAAGMGSNRVAGDTMPAARSSDVANVANLKGNLAAGDSGEALQDDTKRDG